MLRILFAAALVLALPAIARAQTREQALVDRATLTVQEMTAENPGQLQANLRASRAVMICPRVFTAGFIIGGSGGDCVLLARDGSGSWSDPAFYGINTGSVGFQAGIQDSEIVMCILTQKGLEAVMDDQFKLGADAGIAIATIGAGVEGATTAATGADIAAFSRARGLFAGASVAGSLLSSRTGWNQAYYGQPLAARQIVVQMQANNPGADPLRAMLMKWATPGPAVATAYAPQAGYAPQPGYAPSPGYGAPPGYTPASAAPQPLAPAPTGSVQSQPLPPPPRR
jgi:SH3 domain-containing YSC84-like protein 1